MLLGLAAALCAALIYGVGAIVQARAVRTIPGGTGDLLGFVGHALRQPLIWVVLAMYVAGFGLHAVAIERLPLYLAQAGIAMSLPVTAICAGLLSERVPPRQWAALMLVVGGIVLMSVGAGHPGEVVLTAWFPAGCLAAAGLLGLITLSGSVVSGAGLGALAGLGYAGVAVGVRGVGWPLQALSVGAALAVVLFGVFAFWAYSQGLENAQVSVSTATMVVGETVGPALVGVLLLGDGIRDGWAPWVVLGLVLAVVGSIAVGHQAEDRATRATMTV